MQPVGEHLSMYGEPSEGAPLDWTWVANQLAGAGTYWVVSRGPGHPHPRPVWGVWRSDTLHLSIGSKVVARELEQDPLATVHLDSGLDVVIVEGRFVGFSSDADLVQRYDTKYDWSYSIDDYGAFTMIAATTVIAWRAAGLAGREGFRETGRWRIVN